MIKTKQWSPGRLWTLRLLTLGLLLVFTESATRSALHFRYGLPFFRPGDYLAWNYYPAIQQLLAQKPGRDSTRFEVVLLGASVLNEGFSDIGQRLADSLQRERPDKVVRVHNLAVGAHTSLDSRIKYELLQKHHFDLVIFYHGINETRANNCPREIFKVDYSHYAFYQEIYLLRAHPEINFLAFPFFLHFAGQKVWNRLQPGRLVPAHGPRPDWLRYGSDIKTKAPYARNVKAILNLAARKKEPVLLVGFAYYLAPGYTFEKFMAKKLDYGSHESPVELWGLPAHVTKGIAVHNSVLQETAKTHGGPSVLYTDMNARMPKNGQYFDDICHLTPAGSSQWVAVVMAAYRESRRRP